MKKPFISVVIPVYNEERSVGPLYKEIKEVSNKLIKANRISGFEVIFVNDGSTDKTQEALEKMKKEESEKSLLRIIEFRRNFGKAEAYKAGFKLAKGDFVFTMDGDLQDNPQNIPDFIAKIYEGHDVVIGWKYERKDPISKTLPSKLFNAVLRKATGLRLHDFDNGYRCMKRDVLQYLEFYEGLFRHIPVLANSKGFKVAEVKVNHRKRKFGKSKFGFSRLFKGFFDFITIQFLLSYLKRPLHFFGGVGSILSLIGIIIALYLTYLKLFVREMIGGRPLLIFSVLMIIVGFQFVFFGLIGEMIANMSRKEKNYVIKRVI